MVDLTGREEFVRSWILLEAPEGFGQFETFDQVSYSIKDLLKHGAKPVALADGTKKLALGDSTFWYWREVDDKVVLGVELVKKDQNLTVTVVGKDPKLRGRGPYASDLYATILADVKDRALRLTSDQTLSDEGLKLWKRLLKQGYKISVYDNEQPGQSFKQLDTEQELSKFFSNDDRTFRRYQYVVTESADVMLLVRARFNSRRTRELCGTL